MRKEKELCLLILSQEDENRTNEHELHNSAGKTLSLLEKIILLSN